MSRSRASILLWSLCWKHGRLLSSAELECLHQPGSRANATIEDTAGHSMLLFIPIAATILLCLFLRTPWQLILWLFLLVPLVGDVVFVLLPPERAFSVLSADFAWAVIGVYPFALATFSYPAPLLGSFAFFFLRKTALDEFLARSVLYASCTVVGALSGALLMLVATLIGQGQYSFGFRRATVPSYGGMGAQRSAVRGGVGVLGRGLLAWTRSFIETRGRSSTRMVHLYRNRSAR